GLIAKPTPGLLAAHPSVGSDNRRWTQRAIAGTLLEKNLTTPLICLDNRRLARAPGFRAWLPGPFERNGVDMKFLVLVVAICATTQTAIAQTPECRSIANPHARLA